MLKKLYSGVLALFLSLLAVGFYTAPANASETKNVTYCQAQGNGSYHVLTAAESSLIDKDGKLKQGGINENDIIPPFDYNFGGNDAGKFLGTANWADADNQKLWRNNCFAVNHTLTPELPTAPQAMCVGGDTGLVIPTPTNGLTVSSAYTNGTYEVIYGLPTDTVADKYTFAPGFANPVTITPIPAGPGDPYWDDTKGACNLPDTGAGDSIQWWMVPAGAGMILLAALLLVAKPFIGRRLNA